MARLTLQIGLILLALSVALGAFGAHGLESMVTEKRIETWNTAVRYQAWMSLLLVIFGAARLQCARFVIPLIGLGILIFSGSLYALVLFDLGALGAITPIGGVLIIVGLVSAAWTVRMHPPSA